MERALSIYQRALELGFDDCRIARSRALSEQRERLSEWLSSGRYGGLNYMLRNFDKRLDPGLLVEGTRSVIVCAIGYKRPPVTHPLLTHIASYAWGKDYHLVIREKLKYSNIPAPLRGLGIAFIITGLMGISFMCFLGIEL